MPKGSKPALSLTANLKDAPRGDKKVYLDIGAAWPNDYGGFNFRLKDGVKIRLADGTVITGDSHWLTVFDKRDKAKAGGGAADDDWGDPRPKLPEGEAAPPPTDDDLPF